MQLCPSPLTISYFTKQTTPTLFFFFFLSRTVLLFITSFQTKCDGLLHHMQKQSVNCRFQLIFKEHNIIIVQQPKISMNYQNQSQQREKRKSKERQNSPFNFFSITFFFIEKLYYKQYTMILASLYLVQGAKKKKKWDMGNPKRRKEQMAKTGFDFYISPGSRKKANYCSLTLSS